MIAVTVQPLFYFYSTFNIFMFEQNEYQFVFYLLVRIRYEVVTNINRTDGAAIIPELSFFKCFKSDLLERHNLMLFI